MSKLTTDRLPSTRGTQLTSSSNVNVPFTVCFEHKLVRKYTFKELEKTHLGALQRFLDKVCGMTVTEVDKAYKRSNDKMDTFKEMQVQHYEVSKKFRIHGVFDQQLFKVIRIDPNHKFHKS